MDVVEIVDTGLGNTSYVVDLGDGGALVVDPRRDPRPYRSTLEERGLRPRFVVETHLHADFVSGSGELMAQGAELWAPAGSNLDFAHHPLHDEEERDLGGLTLRVVATPGHTPEHLSYLLLDGPTPLALFSGGTLMSGGVARTDLLSPDRTEPLARAAYRSIHERLFTLPEDLVVYPTHGSGSFCSVDSGGEHTTTIGREKASNPLLAPGTDEDAFTRRLLSGYGTYPPYFLELRDVNRRGVEVLGPEGLPLPRLSPQEVENASRKGAEILDARTVEDFAAGHLPGSISNVWRPQFSTWLGWLLPRETPVVLVIDHQTPVEDLVWAALTVGFENLVGVMTGIEAWVAEGRETEAVPLVHYPASVDGRRLLDVRQEAEYVSGHVEGAHHTELGALTDLTTGMADDPLLIHCGHGERAATAASLLQRTGHTDVAIFRGPPAELGRMVTE